MKKSGTTINFEERVGGDKLAKASELLRAIAHPQRLAIVDLLGRHPRLCNREIQEMLGIEQAILSQYLSLMRDKGLLELEKEGKYTFWHLRLPEFLNIVHCLENCCPDL